jgi:hypothetical protein
MLTRHPNFLTSVLFAEQPAHVRKEEASTGIVRIGICVGEFVMNSMIASLETIRTRKFKGKL